MGFSRRPPGLWTDVEVDAELRRSRQLIRAFAAHDAALAQDGDALGQAFASAATQPLAERTALNVNRSELDTYRRKLQPTRVAAEAESGADSLGGKVVSVGSHAAKTADQSALVPLWLGVALLTLGLAFLAAAVLLRQADWWQPGLPLTILGQAALTLGLLLRQRGVARH